VRDEEFPQQVKDRALRRSDNKCERCWSPRDLEFHHKIPVAQGGGSTLDNCVVLCEKCHSQAPLDPIVFEKLYIPFASPKEFALHYNTSNEKEAMKKWCSEMELDLPTVERILDRVGRGELIKERMGRRARDGAIMGFNAPFGYAFENGELRANPKEAITVTDMYQKYLDGQTMKSIAEDLNSMGTRTKKGNKWTVWSVRHILKNPIYAGFVRWGKELGKGKHDPIIDAGTFNSVQKRILSNIRNPRFKYEPTVLEDSS